MRCIKISDLLNSGVEDIKNFKKAIKVFVIKKAPYTSTYVKEYGYVVDIKNKKIFEDELGSSIDLNDADKITTEKIQEIKNLIKQEYPIIIKVYTCELENRYTEYYGEYEWFITEGYIIEDFDINCDNELDFVNYFKFYKDVVNYNKKSLGNKYTNSNEYKQAVSNILGNIKYSFVNNMEVKNYGV